MTSEVMTCDRAEALLSDHVDGTLDAPARAAVDAHLAGCATCAATRAEVAALVADAAALPPLRPARDLWDGIAARIEAPVVALDATRVTRAPARPWWRTAAAAALLVATTAGITWRLATRARPEERSAVATAADTAARRAAPPVAIASAEPAADSSAGEAPAAASSANVTSGAGARVASARRGERARAATTARTLAPLPPAAAAYDQEITALRAIVGARREQLDPRTLDVVERNLRIIDQAITESRAALQRDPASGFLTEQLTRAMRRKLELLRTVADAPARAS